MEWALLPLRKYAVFSGRARRKEYWMFFLLMFVVSILLGIVEHATDLRDPATGFGYLSALLTLAIFVPSIAVTVRRLHDLDRTGWWVLAGVGPYVLTLLSLVMGSTLLAGLFGIMTLIGMITLLVFMILPGTNGPNRFGPDPMREDHRETFA